MATLSVHRSRNPMTTHVCNLAQKVSKSQDDNQTFVDAMNSKRNQQILWRELKLRPSPSDRYSNLVVMHNAFMRLKSSPTPLKGMRSAQLFFVRLAVRTPDPLTTVRQEIVFKPESLWRAYSHLGWRVHVATIMGELSLGWSPQHR